MNFRSLVAVDDWIEFYLLTVFTFLVWKEALLPVLNGGLASINRQ